MEMQQLLNALTDHMGVYHLSKKSTEKRNTAERKKVVDWFKALSVKQRQVAVTVVDKSWVALVIQMQKYVEREGPGSFFLLEDFHSTGLPSLCFRRARGLLKRLSHRGDVLLQNVRLYSSLDGDGVSSIDCLTVSLEFLEDVEGLFAVLDEITYGEFLACQCLYGGSSWVETSWIKTMGYYTLAAFVANRLEISLWSAWITLLGTRQPPKSISKSTARYTVEMVSVAASVCTKRQGFQQWCAELDPKLKEKALQCALAKVSRSKALRTDVQLDKLTVDDDILLTNQHLARICQGIQYILELKSTLTKRLVYSTLFEVHKSTESVVQVVRDVLMKVMKQSMEQELLGHGDEAIAADHKGTKNVQTKNQKNRCRKQKKKKAVHGGADEPGSTDMDRTGKTNKEPVVQWTSGKRKKRKKQERNKSEVPQKKQSEQAAYMENSTCAAHHGDEKVVEITHRDTHSNAKLDTPGACIHPMKKQDSYARAPATEQLHLDVSRCPKPYGHFRPQNGQIDTMSSIEVAHETVELNQIPYDEEYRKLEEAQQIFDYNQIFGAGVMYWNAADYTATCYSRPGSLSSDDSSWARREADLTIVVDDIVGLSTVPYPGLSSGCTSPSSSSSLTIEEVQNGQGVASKLKLEGPVLPPIAVRSSSVKPSKSLKFNGSKLHEARSPRLPRGRREFVRWKRSPSPVLRCVPPAPPPPPPSPVAGVRKRGAFPTARSGSSSPRHWGVFDWPDGQIKSFTSDGILSTAWRRCIPDTVMHPLTGAVLRERLVSIPSTYGQEHPDVAFPRQSDLLLVNNPGMPSVMARLHEEIEAFCFAVKAENERRKPYVDAAVKRVTHALQVLWPRSRTNVFGSAATGLALPNSDVDLVVSLPPVRNLEPIKEAGILEGRNGIKETCLQHAARYLADQEWVKSDSLKIIENTAIPIIILVANCSLDNVSNIQAESEDAQSPFKQLPWGKQEERHLVHLDISFESSSHTGVLTAELVKELIKQCPAITPLALLLKQFLKDRGLHRPYTGGLSSYCLVLLITRFLQHQCHLGWPSQTQNLGILLMDFLHFFGCVYDPRRMCISIRGVGMYVSRDRLHGIDPLHIEDPLFASNNVGHNCFRILQCTKAFADAYLTLEKELTSIENDSPLLPKILPSISIDHQ